MAHSFYEQPILNSPYECPDRHWELDEEGRPTRHVKPFRRPASFISPIPKPKTKKARQAELFEDATAKALSEGEQQYTLTALINELREILARWRALPDPKDWRVTPETARLVRHWRQHKFELYRPFFCQLEAVETAIWLHEVAPKTSKFLTHLENANNDANPGLPRLALKLATGAGKTTVMAMLIAWQTVNAVRHPNSRRFSRGFLVVTPGITIRDRLRVLLPNVGKSNTLGESIRCVVSVSMLTEGWDANTVTHVLGVRAFGTQLLCEQVIGRALRRMSYDLNKEGLFDTEYADVMGIPFDFTAQAVEVKPVKPRRTTHVRAVRPERDHLEIRFPRVAGYRVEWPRERPPRPDFTEDSRLVLNPDLVGPTEALMAGIIGETVVMKVADNKEMRPSELLSKLTKHYLYSKHLDADGNPKLHMYGKAKNFVREWLEHWLTCEGGTYPAMLLNLRLADMACEKIHAAVNRGAERQAREEEKDPPVHAILDPYTPEGSTRHVRFLTSKPRLWQTAPDKCHVNWCVLDSGWEGAFCHAAEQNPKVLAYVKNRNLGFVVPYMYQGKEHEYVPDFLLLVDDGRGPDDPLHLVVEIKGLRDEQDKAKKETMEVYWIPGVNNLKSFGRWAFVELTNPYAFAGDLEALAEKALDAALGGAIDERDGAKKG